MPGRNNNRGCMNERSSKDDRPGAKRPAVDRRAPKGTPQDPAPAMRKLKDALGRPLALERKDGQLRVVLVERRRMPQAEEAPLDARLGLALRAHLARNTGHGRHAAEQLEIVSAQFEDKGWLGVASLTAAVLGRAIVQAEALAREESSDLLTRFIDRLRQVKTVVEAREDRRTTARRDTPEPGSIVVSEATQEEFEALQRSWAGTVPGGLGPPLGDPSGESR
jgi:hypothetical protein